jgi:putative ABC transport system permease protein
VVLTLEDSSKIDAVANEIRASFPNVDVISPQAILQTINSFLTSFQLFLGLIAGVSTLITALCSTTPCPSTWFSALRKSAC